MVESSEDYFSDGDLDDRDNDEFQDYVTDTETNYEDQEQGISDLEDVPLIVPVTDYSQNESECHYRVHTSLYNEYKYA